MPDYLLTGPEGQSFNLTVPEGVSEADIHAVLADLPLPGEPQSRPRGDILAEGVGQMKEALAPSYLKDTPPTHESDVALADPQGQPRKIGPPSGPATAMQMTGGLAGDIASGLVPEGKALGVVAGMGRRAFASPRQIRSHLDELTETVRGRRAHYDQAFQEGRISAPERDAFHGALDRQLADARQSMGLPREVPNYLQPRVVPTRPGVGSRPINPQTLSEMREAPQSLGPTFPQRPLPQPAPLRSQPREGVLGGGPEARSLFAAAVGPHQDETTFARSYFNGAYSPAIKLKRVEESGPGLDFAGDLVLNGDRIGSIHRQIFPDAGYAYNAWLGLKPSEQAGGFTKGLMANQFDLYRKMGLERVDVFASVSVGGYSWAKYGFLPLEQDWRALKDPIGLRLMQMRSVIPADIQELVNLHLSDPDPRAIWEIADIITQVPHPSLKNPTVGKALLAGMDWHGQFRFDNPEQNVRFNDYVAKRQ